MNISTFVVELKKQLSAKEAIVAGNYDEVNYLINQGATKNRFSMGGYKSGERKIVLLEVNDSITSQEILFRASRMDLQRPTYRDAFLFGEQYPEEQKNATIVFLHEPPYYYSGHFFNLVLDVRKNRRRVSFVSSGGLWDVSYRFAFIDDSE